MTDEAPPENVTKLPVRFKSKAPEDRTLLGPYEVGRPSPCGHTRAHYVVDEALAEVECGKCGTKLNPMWVLARLANEDRRMQEMQTRYKDEMKRLDERRRTKCEACGHMTRISRR